MTENEKITLNPDATVTVVPEEYPELQDEIDQNDFRGYQVAIEARKSQCLVCCKWRIVNGIAICSDPPSNLEQCVNYSPRGW